MRAKQQNIIVFTTIIIGMILFNSCEDYFNKVPSDKVRAEDHYQSFIDLQISQTGVFTLLQDVVPNLVIVSELMSDLTTLNKLSNQYLIEINEHKTTGSNPYLKTSGYYKIIIAANEVIEKLEFLKQNDKQLIDDQEMLDNYDRLFSYLVVLKSWCYLTLIKLHGEAAYIEDNIVSLPDDLNLPYLNRNQILDRLVNDLDTLSDVNDVFFEFDVYDEESESTTANNVLMQVININAVIGEVYLEKGDYEKAALHLQIACEELGSLWMLLRAFSKTKWKTIFVNSGFYSNKEEIMFRAAYNLDEGQENPLEKWISPNRDFLIKPTDAIIDLFNQQGSNGDEHRGLDISYGLTTDKTPYINKYSLGERGSSHIILYRTADIILMFAEALNRLGDHEHALELVNEGYTSLQGWNLTAGVRSRVGLSPVNCNGSSNMTECVEDLIMQERALELAFEGKRWFDLIRVARRRGDNAYLADKIVAKFDDPATSNEIRSLLMDESNWYLPFEK